MTRLRHEDAVFAATLIAAAIPAAVALPLLWTGDFDAKTRWTLTLVIVVATTALALRARGIVLRSLQTMSNLIAALRERDYSVRGRHPRNDDALGLALVELAALAGALREERHRDEETAAAMRRVIEQLDVAVVALDDDGVVRMCNRATERLVGVDPIGRGAAEIGLGALDAVHEASTIELNLVGGRRSWEVRPSAVRLTGVPHRLFVLTDVQRALRAEERQAWQRLVRVLGHEINNSLGPIHSIAETLRRAMVRQPRAADFESDLASGLEVIERRAAALARFMTSYTRLARLPPPRPGRVDVAAWVARAAGLEVRRAVTVAEGPPVELPGDADQLDQVLINLVSNAVEAIGDGAGGVRLGWTVDGDRVVVTIDDDGPGLADTANLFVPFFTTKPGGSGIGLVLARQIVEAHGGHLIVRNRPAPATGCQAAISLFGARALPAPG
jgi:nitrogen fixation/metabolism regulation signal transduction histidine kinase